MCARATGFSKSSAGNKGGKKGNEGSKGGSKGGATKGNMTEQQALMLKVGPSILAEASVRAPRKNMYFYYLEKSYLDQSIPKKCIFLFENRSTA